MPRDTPHRRRGGWRTEIEVGEPIQPIKGMNDVLPEEIGTWQYFEACTRQLLAAYGYEEIRVPIAELIALGTRLWERLGIASGLRLEINSLGTPESRRAYRERLVEYLHAHEARLDADSRRRLTVNPLRVLDSKNPQMLEIIAGAPL